MKAHLSRFFFFFLLLLNPEIGQDFHGWVSWYFLYFSSNWVNADWSKLWQWNHNVCSNWNILISIYYFRNNFNWYFAKIYHRRKGKSIISLKLIQCYLGSTNYSLIEKVIIGSGRFLGLFCVKWWLKLVIFLWMVIIFTLLLNTIFYFD